MNKSVLIIAAGIMLLVGGAAACASGGTTPTPVPPIFTPEDILETYRANLANGEDSFEGKKVRVRGTVHSFSDGDPRVAYLIPKPAFRTPFLNNGDFSVFYIYPPREHIATLRARQEYVWDCIVSTQNLNVWRGNELKCEARRLVSRG